MCTRARWKFVAKATALGARVPRAELFAVHEHVLMQHKKVRQRKQTLYERKGKAGKDGKIIIYF